MKVYRMFQIFPRWLLDRIANEQIYSSLPMFQGQLEGRKFHYAHNDDVVYAGRDKRLFVNEVDASEIS